MTRSADVASAMKPVLSTLLWMAVEEGRLAGVDAPVSEVESRLVPLNQGKDATITWRHLASQTSGYGLPEPPGEAWAYNDYALALYHDSLMGGVYHQKGLDVFRSRIADPLGFEDPVTFDRPHPGRLGVSVRDFARFGLLCLRRGRWGERQLFPSRCLDAMLGSVVPPGLPRTRGGQAGMIPGQRSLGGGLDITGTGPGFYSFNWWLNGTNRLGQRLFAAMPPDTFVAAGHGGMRMLWIVPSLDLVVSWNDSRIEDQDRSPEDSNTRCNEAARLMRQSVTGP